MAKVKSQGGLKRLAESIEGFAKKRTAVGFFDNAVYPNGTPVASVAAIHEFGAGRIPPRSFMRSTVTEQTEAWKATLAQGAKRVLADKLDVDNMLKTFGEGVAGQIKTKITSITAPKLSDVTLFLRQNRIDKSLPANTSDKPLVDTSYMLDSVDSKVEPT